MHSLLGRLTQTVLFAVPLTLALGGVMMVIRRIQLALGVKDHREFEDQPKAVQAGQVKQPQVSGVR